MRGKKFHTGDAASDPRKSTYDVERTRSSRSLKSSTGTGKENWQTPGEMSRSFSGDEINPDVSVDGELGNEKSVPLNDESVVRPLLRIWIARR